MKWSKMMQKSTAVEKNMKVKRYIRKGIPNEHRSTVWMIVSGAQGQMELNPGYYHSVLLEGKKNAKLVDAVVTDLNRTFPDNVKFRKSASPCLQQTLHNVLVAYGQHNKTVGYCQGMNFITGILILVTKDEEKAFWLLDALIGRILPDYYSPAMMGLKIDQEVLGDLVKIKIPAVAALIDQHEVMWTLLVSRWFICLFIDILPIETVLRIWDCLFYEGSKILFRVALTLIKHHQAYILEAKNFPDVCDKFKDITKGKLVTECHLFMQLTSRAMPQIGTATATHRPENGQRAGHMQQRPTRTKLPPSSHTRKIFTEPGSLSRSTISKLREQCHAQLLTQE
ncbi:growth hormone-regulated TBC protein 1-like [Dendropsophus ebraccatus]|uniref:growth hormone-regulated TBC protein 1-like n=1 Tax=Dendropsophus ebraccatus TaxID=150705 RepID=UPI0038316A21